MYLICIKLHFKNPIPKHFVFSDKKLPLFSFPKGIFTVRKRSLGQGNIFKSVCHSVHRRGAWFWGVPGPGGCLVPGGVPGPGRYLVPGECLVQGEGVPGPAGCLVPGAAWCQGGAWSRGAWWRPPDDYCCLRYASYWNAFLL